MQVVLPAAAVLQVLEDLAQGGLPEPAQRLRRQLEPLAAAHQPALALQLALELLQGPHVLRRARPQSTLHGLDVDVVERRAGVLLAELVDEVVEIGQLAERACRLPVPQRLVAAHPLAAVPGQVGPQRPQVVVQCGHLRREVGVAERLRHQAGELLALLRRQRCHQPLGGGGLAGQLVDELVDVLRVAGEQVPVLAHELLEVLERVLPARVLVEQLVEVGEHVLQPLVGGLLLGARRPRLHPLQRVAHPSEPLVEHVAAQPVEDVAVDPLGLRRRPAVLGELLDRRRRRARQGVELRLGEPRVVAVDVRQRFLLGGEGLVELRLRAGDGAVEPAAAGHLAAHPHRPGPQVVQPLAIQVAARPVSIVW